MFKGVLVSLLASILFGYMYYFFYATQTFEWHGYFRLSDDLYVSLCCPFRVYV